MARKLRIQFPGAIYHLMSRGDRREDIFRDDVDRESFLKTLADACVKTGWQVHAFVLMPNHFHLVVETPQPNLVAGMKWFLGTYTARFNRRHKISGHVFAGRYKSLMVGGTGGYLRTVCDYVHLNPARARLLSAEQPLTAFPWSSLPWIVRGAGERPSWLRVERLFGECGIPTDDAAGCAEYVQRLEARRAGETDEEFKAVRSGWCFGDDTFRKELLSKIDGAAGDSHFGSEFQEAAEVKATRIIDEELRRALWAEAELELKRKGDPVKLRIARRLREETTVTLQWISARLCMGTKSHLSHLLYWDKRGEKENTSTVGAKAAARTKRSKPVPSGPVKNALPVTKTAVAPKQRVIEAPVLIPQIKATEEIVLPLTDPDAFDTSFD
jgi:putative transposase